MALHLSFAAPLYILRCASTLPPTRGLFFFTLIYVLKCASVLPPTCSHDRLVHFGFRLSQYLQLSGVTKITLISVNDHDLLM